MSFHTLEDVADEFGVDLGRRMTLWRAFGVGAALATVATLGRTLFWPYRVHRRSTLVRLGAGMRLR